MNTIEKARKILKKYQKRYYPLSIFSEIRFSSGCLLDKISTFKIVEIRCIESSEIIIHSKYREINRIVFDCQALFMGKRYFRLMSADFSVYFNNEDCEEIKIKIFN
jgi:hypothetical protein